MFIDVYDSINGYKWTYYNILPSIAVTAAFLQQQFKDFSGLNSPFFNFVYDMVIFEKHYVSVGQYFVEV